MTQHTVPCVGGPLHMRTVNVPTDPAHPTRPSAYLNATAYPAAAVADLTEQGRLPWSVLDSERDIALYHLAPSRIGDAGRAFTNVYRFGAADRESWGWHNDIVDLDETIGRPERLGDDMTWVRRDADLGRPGARDRRDRWAILLPEFDAPTVTVYRTLPAIHVPGLRAAALVLRDPFPLWISERPF